jgi:hypothetical protein
MGALRAYELRARHVVIAPITKASAHLGISTILSVGSWVIWSNGGGLRYSCGVLNQVRPPTCTAISLTERHVSRIVWSGAHNDSQGSLLERVTQG